MLANTASGDRIALFNSHAHDNHLPQFQPPEWAENLHSRAIMYIGSQSHASSLNLSHADLAATLACVVRAGAFVEKEDHQKHRLPRETTQSIDMSIVTLSPPNIPSSPAYDSAYFSPNLSSQTSAISGVRAHAPQSPNFLVSQRNDPVTPSPASFLPHQSPSSVGVLHHQSSPSSRFDTQMAPQSFTFSPAGSPAWTASDEAALQPSHHNAAHYPLLVNIFRHCWTNKIPGRQSLPSEEAAVVAAFLQNYPLPGTTAPQWEVSEWAGTFNPISLL